MRRKTLAAEYRARRIRAAVEAYRRVAEEGAAAIDAFQLTRLNAAWAESLRRSPWARELRARLALPGYFADWKSFRAAVPVLHKPDLRAVLQNVHEGSDEAVEWRATGGSTAQPMRLPVFESEARVAELDHWLGRSRLGIDPADRLFLLWGHGHLFGAGVKGAAERLRRRVADMLLGYTRWSAYRLDPIALRQAADSLLRSKPAYVIGYSTALDRFAQANAARASGFHALNLKAVIATAEAFPDSGSRERIAMCFGAPVVMEYGAVETGPLAYEKIGHQEFDVFTAHHRLECSPMSDMDSASELIVTSLYPRALPLLRYALGDLVVAEPSESTSGVARLHRVIGRSNATLLTPRGTPIHSEAFTHVVRDLPGITAYQIVRSKSGVISHIRYEAQEAIPGAYESELRRRLGLLDPDLALLSIERVDQLRRSIAGKSLMVVDEN